MVLRDVDESNQVAIPGSANGWRRPWPEADRACSFFLFIVFFGH